MNEEPETPEDFRYSLMVQRNDDKTLECLLVTGPNLHYLDWLRGRPLTINLEYMNVYLTDVNKNPAIAKVVSSAYRNERGALVIKMDTGWHKTAFRFAPDILRPVKRNIDFGN